MKWILPAGIVVILVVAAVLMWNRPEQGDTVAAGPAAECSRGGGRTREAPVRKEGIFAASTRDRRGRQEGWRSQSRRGTGTAPRTADRSSGIELQHRCSDFGHGD